MYYYLAILKQSSSVSTTSGSTFLTSNSSTTTFKQISTVPPQCSTVTPYHYVTPVISVDGSLKVSISSKIT